MERHGKPFFPNTVPKEIILNCDRFWGSVKEGTEFKELVMPTKYYASDWTDDAYLIEFPSWRGNSYIREYFGQYDMRKS